MPDAPNDASPNAPLGDGAAPLSRRGFVAGAAALAAGALVPGSAWGAPMVVARHVIGRGYQAPSDTLGLAFVGFGGMGMSNMAALTGERIVALCDVDFPYVERSLAGRLRPRPAPVAPSNMAPEQAQAWLAERTAANARAAAEGQAMQTAYARAPKYADFREMLDKQRKDIDGVVVATPDHMHAMIAERAMRAGKHVYVQKPLTYSVAEARMLARTARENPKVVTQMGNQGHSGDGTRRIRELVRAGVLGPVREVLVWTNRPLGYWAQGIPRPAPAVPNATPNGGPAPTATPGTPNAGPPPPPRWNMRTVDEAVLRLMDEQPHTPPPGLHWDLFLGAAQPVPYHPAYHPFSWRGWLDFGVSSIGDMGAHLIDQPFWALDLGMPTSVSASSTPWGGGNRTPASYPLAMTAVYEFAARPAVGGTAMPPVRMSWFDGGLTPPRPAMLPDDVVLNPDGGGVFVGEKGILVYDTYGNNPRLFPTSLEADAAKVPITEPRITVAHEVNWAQACKGQATASSPFSYAAALTEVMLLGIVALRSGQGRVVHYDAPGMRVANAPEADAFLSREYRAGWSL